MARREGDYQPVYPAAAAMCGRSGAGSLTPAPHEAALGASAQDRRRRATTGQVSFPHPAHRRSPKRPDQTTEGRPGGQITSPPCRPGPGLRRGALPLATIGPVVTARLRHHPLYSCHDAKISGERCRELCPDSYYVFVSSRVLVAAGKRFPDGRLAGSEPGDKIA